MYKGYIYKITNTINGKSYGLSKSAGGFMWKYKEEGGTL